MVSVRKASFKPTVSAMPAGRQDAAAFVLMEAQQRS
jgi:hypothetical protein